MDGVIADFEKAAENAALEKGVPKLSRPDLFVDYRNLDLIPGAKSSVECLAYDFDVFIAMTKVFNKKGLYK